MKMNFNCNSRVDYLVTTYYLGREKAIESLLKDGNCIDVNWVPPSTIDDDNTSDSLSNGAIIGIVIGITILLCCCIGFGSLYYYKRTNQKSDEQAQASQQLPAGSKRAKASEIRKKVMAEANARNNTEDSPDSSSREEQDIKKKKKKSLSFAPPVVWNITQDGDKPDPPTQDEVINKENKKAGVDKDGEVSSSTQQVLDMMESALDTTNKDFEDPPDFRDSTISELSCNIDPPTDDEEEGVVLPSTTDEEQALPNVNSSGQVTNEKQDALAIDKETRQNEEGIVRRISLEP